MPPHPGSTPWTNEPGFEQPENYPATYAGGGSGGCAFLITNFLFVCLCWPLYTCLYPLAVGAGAGVFFLTRPIFKSIILPIDPTGDVAWVAAFFTGMVVLIKIGRREHRWARFAAYRIPRHFVRLAMIALMTSRYVVGLNWIPRRGEPIINLSFLVAPQYFVTTAAVVVGMNFLLWKGDRARRFWHARLEGIGMRPSD